MKPACAQTSARKLTILNQYGICARPAALFVKTASRFHAEVTVTRGDQTVSGKSIMGLMTLEASRGVEVIVKATGPDSREVVDELTVLVNRGFYSDEECLPVPKEHSEWLVIPSPPPAHPPVRTMRVAFAFAPEASREREHLVRTILPSLGRRMAAKHARVRGVDLRRSGGWGAAARGPGGDRAPLDDCELPRPFFLLLGGREAGRFQGLDLIPREVADLRALIERGTDHRPLPNDATNTLVRCYPWSDASGSYVLRPGVALDDAAMLETVFRRRHDYLREHCLVLLPAQPSGLRMVRRRGPPEDFSELRQYLDRYGWAHLDYAGVPGFGRAVRDALARWLESE